MSSHPVLGLATALLLATACAEGASGPGTTSGGGGDAQGGGAPSGSGGAGQGGAGNGGDGSGAAPNTSSQSSGGDGGGGGGGGEGSSSTSSSTSSDASSSAMSSSSGQAEPGTIYFSEYVEGSGNNKALEIYNAGGAPIDLGNCRLDRYQNGASEPAALALEDTMLATGAVFVICQSNFAQPGLCDQSTADIQHNGDDAVALVCDGATKDIFGRIGEDAVWGEGVTSSEDATLRRKCSVLDGDTNGSDAFDPATEWDGVGVDVFDDLGQYDCP